MKLLKDFLIYTYKNKPSFFVFVIIFFLLYGLQLVFRTEITPLGYFSLYSDATSTSKSYKQILPTDLARNSPINIYKFKGTAFLPLEILPTRYEILRKSENCNQMNFKLQRFGFTDRNTTDCEELKRFKQWFKLYAERQGLILKDENWSLDEYGFLDGKLISKDPLQ